MDNQSFIQAIQTNPSDEIPRLIYADWLDERGDPRGELIRVQCEIARSPENDLKRKQLAQRADELLEDYGETWLEPLRELGALGVSTRCFHLGMLEHLKISAEDFLEHAESLCEIEPALTRVQLTKVSMHLEGLVNRQLPGQISDLDLSANQLISYECETFRGSLIPNQLKSLDLKFNQLDDDGVSELCLTHWPRLERLDLSGNRIGPGGASALAKQSVFPQLKVLNLSSNGILDQGASAFFESETLENLEELHLASNGITKEAPKRIKSSAALPALRILNLRYNGISIADQESLSDSPLNRRLEQLDLTGNIRRSTY